MEEENQQLCSQSTNRITYARIELLDKYNNIVDNLEGQITDGSISLTNSTSGEFSRITGSITLLLTKDLSTDYFKIDLSHRIRVIMMVKDVVTDITAEYNLGMCLMNSPQIMKSTNSSENKITIELLDLFSNYNGDLGGNLVNKVHIDNNGNLTNLLYKIATDVDLMNLPSNQIKIEPNSFTIPMDIDVDAGNNITDVLKKLMELYMGYELFFDRDGILTYQKIKDYKTDSPIQEFIDSPMIISYSPKNDFKNVANVVVVKGSIQETGSETTPVQYEATATLSDENHPLSTTKIGGIGIRKKVVADDKAQSNEACQSEADYKLTLYSNYAEKIDISMLPDFRLVPNRVVKIQYEDEDISIEGRYIINTINFGLKFNDLSSLNVSKLYGVYA